MMIGENMDSTAGFFKRESRYFSNCLHTENDMKNVKDLLHKRQLTLEKVHFAT